MGDRNVLERILAGLEKPTDLALAVLQDVTENFSEERKFGQGAFGEVYKGVLQNGNVAVKKIVVNENTLDDQSFRREVNSLSFINHPNVVRFLGYCSNTIQTIQEKGSEENIWVNLRERLLCFEYVSKGSLDKHITDELRGLEWDARHKIIKGICEGLHYLHKEKKIIHMDLKPANILLDDAMVPKITDFGLSRPTENSHTAGQRFGTPGYCAPEYTNDGKMSTKSDIYSLGLVITELVTGRKDIPDKDSKKHNILRRWRHRWNNPPTPLQYRQVIKCMEISVKCRERVPEHRPHVWDIIGDLDKVESTKVHSGLINPYLDDDMLGIEPLRLHFKQMMCELKLTNKTKNCFAFNIQSTSMQYSLWPDKGIVRSGHVYIVKIKLKAQETVPQVTQNAEEFIVQSIKVSECLGANDITERMFREEAREVIDEVVVYRPKKSQENVPAEKGVNSTMHAQFTEQLDRRNFHPPENFSDSQPTNMTYLQTVSDRTMDITTGAMGSLLHKLGELLKEEFNLEMRVKKDVEYFSNELKMMHAALHQVSQVQPDNPNYLVKHWVNDVRELSYDVEDVVDGFQVHSEPAANSGELRKLTHQMLNHNHQIADVIKGIKVQVKEVAERHDKYGVSSVAANNRGTATTFDPRTVFLYKDQRELAGIDGTRDELIKILTDGDADVSKAKQLKIISIYGFGGLGKTTLAKAVYDRIRLQFECTAFVSVGRNPVKEKLLRDIMWGLDKKKYKDITAETLGVYQLIDELRELTQNKRYFIVIDDIWTIHVWEIISCAFMDSAHGSRILTTTRNLDVAQKTGAVYKLEPLSSDNSKELLYRGLYGGKGKCPNDHPDELTKKILHKCGGVPLAIITIASLLHGKPRDDWSKVYTSIGFESGENKDVDNTRTIILFSYYDLPCQLRTCLLHLSIFPEDYEIDKEVLIWKWVAEGIVREEQGIGLFELGERYFNELINRSMIQVAGWPFNPTSSCRIHDLVLDMIRSLSTDNNFVIVLDNIEQHTSPQNKARRIAVQNGVLEQDNHLAKTQMPQVRSFYAIACRISVMPSLSSFEALRVLDMASCIFEGDHHHLEHIGKLLQLRYLGLSKIHISELPEEIGYLRFLQTLYLKSDKIEKLPHTVGLLRQLKCLHAERCGNLTVPDWIGNLTSLEELRLDEVESPNFPEELRKLEQLRVLCIRFPDPENVIRFRALLESIANLKKIQRLELVCDCDDCSGDIWEGFEPPKALRVLGMALTCSELPTWINSADIPQLTHLYVRVNSLETQHVETLGRFKELLALELTHYEDDCPLVVISGDAFPKLTYLETTIALRFEPRAMPNLEHLEFGVLVKRLHDAHFDFDFSSLGNLPMLGSIRVEIWYHGANYLDIKKAEAWLRHTVRIHPNRPILGIVRERMDDMLEFDEEDADAFNSEQTDEEFLRGLMTDQKIHTGPPAKKKRKVRRRRRRTRF